MDAVEHQLAGVLDEAALSLEESLADNQKLAAENLALKKQLEQHKEQMDRVYLEKVASSAKEASARVTERIVRLRELNLIEEREITKLASDVTKHPEKALDLLIKVAEASLTSPEEGVGVARTNDTDTEDDPDGWERCARNARGRR